LRFFDYLTEKGEQEEYSWQRIEYPQKTGWNGHTYSPFTHLMKIGDKIAIWVTGEKAGFYAIGEIKEVPIKRHEPDPEKLHYYQVKVEPDPIPTVKIRLMATFLDKPIIKEQCDSDPILSSVINPKKTDFPIYWMRSVQWFRIASLLQTSGVEIKESTDELNTLRKYS
jgi:predicted RNA-binding protein with PUA-like domain